MHTSEEVASILLHPTSFLCEALLKMQKARQEFDQVGDATVYSLWLGKFLEASYFVAGPLKGAS